MRRNLQCLFIYFLLYSVIGWLYEVFLEVVVYQWGYSDRGVLFGPYCPVYGIGALLFLLCFSRLLRVTQPRWLKICKPVLLFLGCMTVATLLELAASYLLELLTGSWPWQTYLDYACNFQGRIALSPSIRFGLGGLIFLFLLQPLFEKLTNRMPDCLLNILSGVLAALFSMDLLCTVVFNLL